MDDQIIKILLVDSGDVDIDKLRQSLKDHASLIQLDSVPDLANAWEKLEDQSYHLLMANYVLPDGSGRDLLGKEKTEGIPVIILGDMGEMSIVRSVIHSGAADFWPISQEFYSCVYSNFIRVLLQHERLVKEQRMKRLFEKERLLFRTFIDNVPDNIYFKDRKSRFIRINKALAKCFQLKDPLQVIGKTDFDFFDKQHAQPAFEIEQQIMKTGETIRIEEKEIWPDGRENWVSTIKIPYFDQEGNPSGTFGISKDITEQKNAQINLKKERDLISAILDTANVLIVVYNTEGRIVRFNQACSELTGYSIDQVKNRIVWEILIPDEERSSFQSYFKYILAHRSQKSVTKGWTRQYLKQAWIDIHRDKRMIEWSSSVLFNEKRDVEFVVNIGIDVTERNEAQETIRRYSDTLNYMDMGMHIYHLEDLNDDLSLRMADLNPAAEKITGIPKEKCIGQYINSIFPNLRAMGIPKILADVVRQRHSKELGEIPYSDDRIKPSWYYVRAFPLPNHHVVISFEDVTERKIMESQSLQTQKLESIGQLAAGIAHEINTPIQYVGDNIQFFSESFKDIDHVINDLRELLNQVKNNRTDPVLIQELESHIETYDIDYLLSEIPSAINQSLEGIERVAKIVRAMKEFSHPASKEKVNIDINQMIETTVTVSRNEWKYVAVMDLQLDPSMPLVPCLPDEFNQVLLNIIINAAHAINDVVEKDPDELGKITIQSGVQGEYAMISISDTGIGISKENQRKIFDPFFTTKEIGKGTGQGLAISHDVIVKKHGGKIMVESTPGKGSIFTILLPIQRGTEK